MPDFDTRTPQEPDQPSEPRSSNQAVHILSRWRDRITVRLRWVRTIVRNRWGVGLGPLGLLLGLLSLLCLPLVLLGLLLGFPVLMDTIDWIVESPTERRDRMAREQIGQQIQLPSAPGYFENRGDFRHNPAYGCEPRVDQCPYIGTEATSAKKLASITKEISHSYIRTDVISVRFYDEDDDPWSTKVTSYCFEDKDAAVSALRGALDEAELLGKTGNCYVGIYEGYGPLEQW
jgi:hypothetical protein